MTEVFQSEHFDLALHQLMHDVQTGLKFTPVIKNIFKSYDLCPLDKVKVVIIDNNPNPEAGISDGLAFSNYPNAFKKALVGNQPVLDYLPQREGVMLLTKGLTCPVGRPENHVPMWEPVIEMMIKSISYRTTNTIFVFVGENTESLSEMVGKNHLKFFIPQVKEEWDSSSIFGKINDGLIKLKKEPVTW